MSAMDIVRGKKILVAGLGRTGTACVEALRDAADTLWITDTRKDLEKLRPSVEKAEMAGAKYAEWGDGLNKLGADMVVTSPGIAIGNDCFESLRESGTPVISELELASRMMRGRMMAITGTNGKTTVTKLAGDIASAYFEDVRVTGNIGTPLISAVADSTPETVFVTEVSSYQLEGCDAFAPHIAVVLNLQPDHRERHPKMEDYAAAKRKILEHQTSTDFAILNASDVWTRNMRYEERGRAMWFRADGPEENGGGVEDGVLTLRRGERREELTRVEALGLLGAFNVENVLAASLGAWLMGVPVEKIRERVELFRPLEHRMEKVEEIDGTLFVNDSKATNIDAVVAALGVFSNRPVCLVLGGDDKGLDVSELIEAARNSARHVVFLGDGLKRVMEEMRRAGIGSITTAESMDEVVEAGLRLAGPNGVVLLSPSSSSFDRYGNYEERGRDFKDAVRRKTKR